MATIKSFLALEDRMTPTLSKAEKQAIANARAFDNLNKETKSLVDQIKEMEKAGLSETKMFSDLSNAIVHNAEVMADYAEGTRNAKIESDSANDSMSKLTGTITRLAGAYLGIAGMKKLMGLSDTFTQTTARLNMMNDGLQTTQELQSMIYNSAQRSRVAYQGMADSVAKLGMQAGDAFGNNTKQIVQFSELLNKLFTTAGMDSSSIQSVMYNMTQSLSTGALLGQDYRILKQNAPQMISYLKQFYGNISQAELDALVSAGKVSAQDLKSAMFAASDDINKKFNQIPVTFEQAWTKFTNTIQKTLIPVLNALSTVASAADQFFTFLSENEYILWLVAAGIAAIVAPLVIYNATTGIATFVTTLFSSSLQGLYLRFALVTVGILALVGWLIYLWNTNDDVAYGMLYAWDAFLIGLKTIKLGITSILYSLVKLFEDTTQKILTPILGPINAVITAMNAIDGGNRKTISVDFGSSTIKGWIDDQVNDITNTANEMNRTRADRVANRNKIGYNPSTMDDLLSDVSNINSAIDPSSSNGAALKTTTADDLLKEEDIQLLLDVATRDVKLNYQQITPEITLTFGDIHETADVDGILENIVNQIQEVYEGNLEVVPE